MELYLQRKFYDNHSHLGAIQRKAAPFFPRPPITVTVVQPALTCELTNLYVGHWRWLRGWLAHRLGNDSDAADLAQDTFIRVIRSRDAASIRQPREFLATVAKGLLIDLFRRRAYEQAYLNALAQMPEQSAPSPEERALIIDTLLEIERLLDGLGSVVKRTFLLSQCDGLTYAVIAKRLNISLRTVNNHMAKAMEHCCRARLAQNMQ